VFVVIILSLNTEQQICSVPKTTRVAKMNHPINIFALKTQSSFLKRLFYRVNIFHEIVGIDTIAVIITTLIASTRSPIPRKPNI